MSVFIMYCTIYKKIVVAFYLNELKMVEIASSKTSLVKMLLLVFLITWLFNYFS